MTVSEGHRFPDREFMVDRARVEEFVLAVGAEPEEGWIAQQGATVLGCCFVIELEFLKGRERLAPVPTEALIAY